MQSRCYIGIDSHDGKEWTLALLACGKAMSFHTYRNTAPERVKLARFIGEHCAKPKICLKPANRAAIRLLKVLGGIPNVEVVLVSQAGLAMHQSWLRHHPAALSPQASQASMLAHCAQRMI